MTVKTDSEEAWELFRERPEQFDVVITDQIMPILTGIDLVRKVVDGCVVSA